jgi:BirA family biotin operon repressor/biotin-[acetyl-CoA-carboxylase] ligase
LRAEVLRAALGESFIGNEIVVLEETTSSNDVVWQLACEGGRAGLVVFAERQTAARGQRGNRWEAATQLGLWFSILLRPGIEPVESPRLTSWTAEAIARTIEEQIGIAPRIKMPNDVYVGERKVAGVLVEMRVEKNGAYAAIAGLGVNVNHTASDFSPEVRPRAGSLFMVAGKKFNRESIAIALLRNLDRSYRALFTA